MLQMAASYLAKVSFLTVMFLAALSIISQSNVQAASLPFSPSNIISDDVFVDKNSLKLNEIQTFLESKNSGLATYSVIENCDPGNDAFYEKYFNCGERATAAEVIYHSAQAYGINPQVILATLQKEQSLVTTPNPTASQLDCAMGYLSCGGSHGFFAQVDDAVWQFRTYIELMNGRNWWGYSPASYPCKNTSSLYSTGLYPGRKVTFSDFSGVKYATVTLANSATAALYCYTPHAYNNPDGLYNNPQYGTTGEYFSGSYNFATKFISWFGSLQKTLAYQPLASPRWMELSVTTKKINPSIGVEVDGDLAAGTQIYFSSKVQVNGQWYLRTQHDTRHGVSKGILLSKLEDIPVDFTSLLSPRWMELTRDIRKVNPLTNQPISGVIPAGTQIYFPTKFAVGYEQYLRTQHDTDLGITDRAIPYSSLTDATVTYTSLQKPRWMQASTDTHVLDIPSYSNQGSTISKGTQRHFNYKVITNGESYLTDSLPASGTFIGIPLSDLEDVPYGPLQEPRYMVTHTSLQKEDPVTGESVGPIIPAGARIFFTSKISVNGTAYIRTQHDTGKNITLGIPLSQLEENYISLVMPREMTTRVTTYRINPTTGANVGSVIPAGTKFFFQTKLDIYGQTYLRTDSDSAISANAAIPLSQLAEVS